MGIVPFAILGSALAQDTTIKSGEFLSTFISKPISVITNKLNVAQNEPEAIFGGIKHAIIPTIENLLEDINQLEIIKKINVEALFAPIVSITDGKYADLENVVDYVRMLTRDKDINLDQLLEFVQEIKAEGSSKLREIIVSIADMEDKQFGSVLELRNFISALNIGVSGAADDQVDHFLYHLEQLKDMNEEKLRQFIAVLKDCADLPMGRFTILWDVLEQLRDATNTNVAEVMELFDRVEDLEQTTMQEIFAIFEQLEPQIQDKVDFVMDVIAAEKMHIDAQVENVLVIVQLLKDQTVYQVGELREAIEAFSRGASDQLIDILTKLQAIEPQLTTVIDEFIAVVVGCEGQTREEMERLLALACESKEQTVGKLQEIHSWIKDEIHDVVDQVSVERAAPTSISGAIQKVMNIPQFFSGELSKFIN
jgi:energy-converting hydrogenase A subunit M